MGRLIRQTSVKQDQNPLIDRRYRYDKSGNLKQIDDLKQGTTKFHYDALDRLKAVEGLTPERFAFDPAGNLIDTETPASGGYVTGNRLRVFQDYRFEYDDAGNLIREKKGKKETLFSYNAQNQLIKVEKEGQAFEYAYDPFGRRIRKKDAFGETTFLWDGDVLLSEQRQNINITYLHEPYSFIPLAQVKDGQIYHYHNDHLGTPQLLTDQQGEVVWEGRYKVYGNVVQYEVEAVENNIRFQGQYFDAETGLHYNRSRYYHPVIGRFTTVDPIGLLGGENNYEYAPNPTGWVDPLGLKCNEWNQFQKDTKGHFANSKKAAESYKKMKQAQAMPKGTRPDASSYLPKSYIDTHLAKFDNGASRFMTKSNLNKYGPGQRDGTSFVMPKSEADEIVANTKGDEKLLEDALGLPPGQLNGNQLVRVDFNDPKDLGLRMPSGNEAGANDLWKAGGKLPDGSSEAVIDAGGLSPSKFTTTDITK